MWGNLTGWLISGVIVAVTFSSLWLIDRAGRPSAAEPWARDPAATAPLSLPPAGSVVPRMTGDRDSVDLYRQAADFCRENREACEAFVRQGKLADLARFDGLLARLDHAAESNVARFFLDSPAQVISYDNVKPELQLLDLAGRVALRAALVQMPASESAAIRDAESAFSLGRKLFDERLTYEQLDIGLQLLAEATALLMQIARESPRLMTERYSGLAGFDAARRALFADRITPVASRMRSVDGNVIAANAGNVLYWSRYAGDRMWRVEAILSLGRMRFFVGQTGRGGDQRAAEKVLRRLRDDPDPVIRAAADAALSLTLEQYRLLR